MQSSIQSRASRVRPPAALRPRVLAVPTLVVVAISVALLLGSVPSGPWHIVLLFAAVGAPLAFAAVTNARSSALAHQVSELRSDHDSAQQEMASIAHDLRGPLSTVTSYLDLIAEGALGPVSDDTRVAAQRAAEASHRARTLVESALLQHVEAAAARPLDVAPASPSSSSSPPSGLPRSMSDQSANPPSPPPQSGVTWSPTPVAPPSLPTPPVPPVPPAP